MEIEGYVGSIMEVEGRSEIRFLGIHYGFLNLKYIVVWTCIDSDQVLYAVDACNREYKVGIRYDRETKELLGIWKKGE
jgi:hypothetical protein